MLRRRLALYTMFYIAGITAGFFMLERSRIPEAAGFCAAVIAAVCFTDPSSLAGLYPGQKAGYEAAARAKHLDRRKEAAAKQKSILMMMLLAGMLLFAIRSISYDSAAAHLLSRDRVQGKVTSVSVKEGKIRFIVKSKEKGQSKILVILDEHAAERSAEKSVPYTQNGLAPYGVYGYLGAEIEARGEYAEISSADNPGCFDYRLYMRSKGVSVSFNAYIIEVTDTGASPFIKIRRYLISARESFISRFDSETRGFIRGVIFGDKSDIDEEMLEEFNSNSTGHILAVSGLHIGFLYGLLRFLTARKRTFPVSLTIIAAAILYGEMTMWSPATVRACIVMTVSLCSTHLRRCSDLLTSVSLAAFIILTFQPYQLFSSGFQLSFLALCAITFLTGPIASVTGEAIAVMIAVQTGTLPVIAFSYCSINPLSILINVPVILLASVLVPVCILMLMFEVAVGMVPETGIDLAELISYAVIKINHILSFNGSFSIKTAGPGAAVIIMIYLIVFGSASEWVRVMLLRKELKTVLKQGMLILMPLAMLFSCLYDPISDDEIVFVSVGQGDSVHIRTEEHNVLIDGGGQVSYGSGESGSNIKSDDSWGSPDKETGYNVGKNILMPYLMHGGADAVDIALVTHLHADHYKGITELAEVFPIGAIGVPADYRGSLGLPKVRFIDPDTQIDLTDEVKIDVIWPVKVSDEPVAADDPNEHNTVYMIHYGNKKIMVTGDLLEEDEQDMIGYYRHTSEGLETLKCDVLKVAHHGSKSSSSEEFLDAASPEIAVIQCGRNNFYGHPHKQTLERLEKRGIKVFRTDLNGAVGIDICRNRLSVDLYKE